MSEIRGGNEATEVVTVKDLPKIEGPAPGARRTSWEVRALAAEDALTDLRAKHARIVYTFADMLSRFSESGYPGQDCRRTGWVRTETVEGWHKTYREATS